VDAGDDPHVLQAVEAGILGAKAKKKASNESNLGEDLSPKGHGSGDFQVIKTLGAVIPGLGVD